MQVILLLNGGAFLFICFAYWQINDRLQYQTNYWYIWFTIMALFVAFLRILQIDISADTFFFNPQSPVANESGGLLLIAVWFLFLYKISSK